jgi:transposase-like protein
MDGLPGIEEAFHKVYPKADIQRCVVHKVRNSIRKIRKRDYQKFTESLKSIYKAPSHEQALIMLDTLGDKWAHIYPEIVSDWRENHENLLTFFKYPTTIRQSIYTNNWIERTNKEFQRRLKTKDSMPTVKAAEKIIYMQSITMNQKWSKRKMRGFASAYDDLQDIFEDKYGN